MTGKKKREREGGKRSRRICPFKDILSLWKPIWVFVFCFFSSPGWVVIAVLAQFWLAIPSWEGSPLFPIFSICGNGLLESQSCGNDFVTFCRLIDRLQSLCFSFVLDLLLLLLLSCGWRVSFWDLVAVFILSNRCYLKDFLSQQSGR